MISKADQNKWRIKDPVGELPCNDRRQSEGKVDHIERKSMAARAVSKIKHVVISAAMKAILLARFMMVGLLFLLCCLVLPAASILSLDF